MTLNKRIFTVLKSGEPRKRLLRLRRKQLERVRRRRSAMDRLYRGSRYREVDYVLRYGGRIRVPQYGLERGNWTRLGFLGGITLPKNNLQPQGDSSYHRAAARYVQARVNPNVAFLDLLHSKRLDNQLSWARRVSSNGDRALSPWGTFSMGWGHNQRLEENLSETRHRIHAHPSPVGVPRRPGHHHPLYTVWPWRSFQARVHLYPRFGHANGPDPQRLRAWVMDKLRQTASAKSKGLIPRKPDPAILVLNKMTRLYRREYVLRTGHVFFRMTKEASRWPGKDWNKPYPVLITRVPEEGKTRDEIIKRWVVLKRLSWNYGFGVFNQKLAPSVKFKRWTRGRRGAGWLEDWFNNKQQALEAKQSRNWRRSIDDRVKRAAFHMFFPAVPVDAEFPQRRFPEFHRRSRFPSLDPGNPRIPIWAFNRWRRVSLGRAGWHRPTISYKRPLGLWRRNTKLSRPKFGGEANRLYTFQRYKGKYIDLLQVLKGRSRAPDIMTRRWGNKNYRGSSSPRVAYFDGAHIGQTKGSPWGDFVVPGMGLLYHPLTFAVHGMKPRFVDRVGPRSRFLFKTPWKQTPYETPMKPHRDGPIYPRRKPAYWKGTHFVSRNEVPAPAPHELTDRRFLRPRHKKERSRKDEVARYERTESIPLRQRAFMRRVGYVSPLYQMVDYLRDGVKRPATTWDTYDSFYPGIHRWAMPYSNEWYHSVISQYRPWTKHGTKPWRWAAAHAVGNKERTTTMDHRLAGFTKDTGGAPMMDALPTVTNEDRSLSSLFVRTPRGLRVSNAGLHRSVEGLLSHEDEPRSLLAYGMAHSNYHRFAEVPHEGLVHKPLAAHYRDRERSINLALAWAGALEHDPEQEPKPHKVLYSLMHKDSRHYGLGGPDAFDFAVLMRDSLAPLEPRETQHLRPEPIYRRWSGKVNARWHVERKLNALAGFMGGTNTPGFKDLSAKAQRSVRRQLGRQHLVPDRTLVKSYFKNRKLKGDLGFAGPWYKVRAPRELLSEEENNWRAYLLRYLEASPEGVDQRLPRAPYQSWMAGFPQEYTTSLVPTASPRFREALKGSVGTHSSRDEYSHTRMGKRGYFKTRRAYLLYVASRAYRAPEPVVSEDYYRETLSTQAVSLDKALQASSVLPWTSEVASEERYVKESRHGNKRVDMTGTVGVYNAGHYLRRWYIPTTSGLLHAPYPRRWDTKRRDREGREYMKHRRTIARKWMVATRVKGRASPLAHYQVKRWMDAPAMTVGTLSRKLQGHLLGMLWGVSSSVGGTKVYNTPHPQSRLLRRRTRVLSYTYQYDDLVSAYSAVASMRATEERAFEALCGRLERNPESASDRLVYEVGRLSEKLVRAKELLRELESRVRAILTELVAFRDHRGTPAMGFIGRTTRGFLDESTNTRQSYRTKQRRDRAKRGQAAYGVQMMFLEGPEVQWKLRQSILKYERGVRVPKSLRVGGYELGEDHGWHPEAVRTHLEQKAYRLLLARSPFTRFGGTGRFYRKPKKQKKRRRSTSWFSSTNLWVSNKQRTTHIRHFRPHVMARVRIFMPERGLMVVRGPGALNNPGPR